MDTRLIFRDRSWTTKSWCGAGLGRWSVPIGHGASKPAGVRAFGRVPREVGDLEAAVSGDSIEPDLQEKLDQGSCERPYRKPTRVAGCESTEVDG
jgi:hypothetical protein